MYVHIDRICIYTLNLKMFDQKRYMYACSSIIQPKRVTQQYQGVFLSHINPCPGHFRQTDQFFPLYSLRTNRNVFDMDCR